MEHVALASNSSPWEPAFLPLLPPVVLADLAGGPTRSFPTPPSYNCTISSLRNSFLPFPLPESFARPQRRTASPRGGYRKRRRTNDDLADRASAARWPATPSLGVVSIVPVPVVVREMKRSDLDAVKRLHGASLPLAFPSVFYTQLLTFSSHLCLLAFSTTSPSPDASALLGCISAHSPSPTSLYLSSLAVAPTARRQGLASLLFHSLVQKFQATSVNTGDISFARPPMVIELHVQATNVGARRFYERLGLRQVGVKKRWYKALQGDESDAVEMKGLVK